MMINGRPMMPYAGEYLALAQSKGLRWDELEGRYLSAGTWHLVVRVVRPLSGGRAVIEEYDGYRSRQNLLPGTRPAVPAEIRAWHTRRASDPSARRARAS